MSEELGASAAEDEVQQWVSVLLAAAIGGSVVDGSDGQPMPSLDAPWPEARTIPAAALRQTLLSARDHRFDPQGLRITGMALDDLVDLRHIEFPYPLHLVGCRLSEGLVMDRASFKDIHLTGSQVAGLLLDRASIDGNLFLDNGFTTIHGVSLSGASISGDINLCGAVLRNHKGWALRLDGAVVAGSVFGQRGFAAIGGIRAYAVRIGGQLRISTAVLRAHAGIALGMDMAKIDGGIDAERISAAGAVVATRAEVLGEFSLDGAAIRNRGAIALALDGMHLKGSLYMRAGFMVVGRVHISSARIDDQFALYGGTFVQPTGLALALQGTTIGGDLIFAAPALGGAGKSVIVSGIVQMIGANIGRVVLSGRGALPTVDATGFTVTDVYGDLRDDWRFARRWLRNSPPEAISAQPWHAVAAVYARNGHPDMARRLRFAAAQHLTRNSPWSERVWRACYGAIVGYGYHWWRAGVWLLATVVAGIVIVSLNGKCVVPTDLAGARAAVAHHYQQRHEQPSSLDITADSSCEMLGDYPCPSKAMFAISVLAPAPLGVAPGWTVVGWLAIAMAALKSAIWALAAVFLAGMTGILQKL
ncbi:hypothetical protein [Mycobacterium sp.]|uniref:hypothetical protein n=1 Tax=Mycobacterium sp. TaxID=1785 RepID=UPI001218FCB6|nr:hypothetical protein [Mycobacterium sp.]TAM69151.1 MAG: hypothetical protein EPN51_09720 [Mycobacterium sp.]